MLRSRTLVLTLTTCGAISCLLAAPARAHHNGLHQMKSYARVHTETRTFRQQFLLNNLTKSFVYRTGNNGKLGQAYAYIKCSYIAVGGTGYTYCGWGKSNKWSTGWNVSECVPCAGYNSQGDALHSCSPPAPAEPQLGPENIPEPPDDPAISSVSGGVMRDATGVTTTVDPGSYLQISTGAMHPDQTTRASVSAIIWDADGTARDSGSVVLSYHSVGSAAPQLTLSGIFNGKPLTVASGPIPGSWFVDLDGLDFFTPNGPLGERIVDLSGEVVPPDESASDLPAAPPIALGLGLLAMAIAGAMVIGRRSRIFQTGQR